MTKAKKTGKYIICAYRAVEDVAYFVESVSRTKGTCKLLPLKDIDKAKTYASAETAEKDCSYIRTCIDHSLSCNYDTPDNWRIWAERALRVEIP